MTATFVAIAIASFMLATGQAILANWAVERMGDTWKGFLVYMLGFWGALGSGGLGVLALITAFAVNAP